VTDEADRIGEQAARASADVFRQSTETARATLQAGLNTASESLQRVTDQVTQALGASGPQAEELSRHASQNLQAVTQASTVLARGFQEASNEVFRLAQERLTKNMDGLNQLAGCRSLQDFVAVQSDLARDTLWQVIETNKPIAEVSVRAAEEATRAIQGQANQARRAA
jgi:hypothetical protein